MAAQPALVANCSRKLPIVDIPDRGSADHKMWLELMRLAKNPPAPWTLIDAHMVSVHAWALERQPIRTSLDADVLVDVRLVTGGTAQVSRALLRDGFELVEYSSWCPEGHKPWLGVHLSRSDQGRHLGRFLFRAFWGPSLSRRGQSRWTTYQPTSGLTSPFSYR
jgi:hypothetical protein